MKIETKTSAGEIARIRPDLPPGEIKRLDAEFKRLEEKATAQNWSPAVREKAMLLLAAEWQSRLSRIQTERRQKSIADKAGKSKRATLRKMDAHTKVVLGALLMKVAGAGIVRYGESLKIDESATEAAIRALLGVAVPAPVEADSSAGFLGDLAATAENEKPDTRFVM